MSTQAEQAPSAQTTLAGEIGLLLLLSLIWGSSFTLIKVAIPTIPPFTMVAVRVTLAAILLLLIATAQGHALPRQGPVWASQRRADRTSGAFQGSGLLRLRSNMVRPLCESEQQVLGAASKGSHFAAQLDPLFWEYPARRNHPTSVGAIQSKTNRTGDLGQDDKESTNGAPQMSVLRVRMARTEGITSKNEVAKMSAFQNRLSIARRM
nr:EamA family transporter [Bradyrhizobium sp. CCBAU 53338]